MTLKINVTDSLYDSLTLSIWTLNRMRNRMRQSEFLNACDKFASVLAMQADVDIATMEDVRNVFRAGDSIVLVNVR